MPPRRCGRCAAAVGQHDEVCATCGSPVSRGALSGGRLVLAVAVAALLLFVGGVGALAALTLGGERELHNGAAPVAAVEEGAEQTSPFETAVEDLAVGETAEVAGARVTLDGVRALPVTDADQPRKRGHVFLAGSVTFENVSEEPVVVSDLLEFALEGEAGRVAVRTFHGDQRPLDEGGEVAPGDKVGGEIVYEIPRNARGLRLGYDPAGGGSYAWLLGDAAKFFKPASDPTGGQGRTEAGMVLAVEDYYRAVDREDWAYTYDLLASGTRSAFTEAEWEQKNRWFADNFPARLAALEVETRMFTPSALVAEVTVNRTFADGVSVPRDTTFVYENGSWKHLFSRQEVSLFLPGVPFERFVAAQQASGVTPADQEAAVKEATRGHYEAIGREEFAAAYSYFGPNYRKLEGRRAWISSQEIQGITASTINYLDVTYADGITAAATVDVTFQDDTGAPRFLITWILTKQNGAWKLDRQTSAERL